MNALEGVKFENLKSVAPGQVVRSEMASKAAAAQVLKSVKGMRAPRSSMWNTIMGASTSAKPHKLHDPKKALVDAVIRRDGGLLATHFKVVRKLGQGDVGSVHEVLLLGVDGATARLAIKRLNKHEMINRNKVRLATSSPRLLSSSNNNGNNYSTRLRFPPTRALPFIVRRLVTLSTMMEGGDEGA